jgi:hypothetical protein
VAVEKLLPAKLAKLDSRKDALQTIFSGRQDFFYPPKFGCWRRKSGFVNPHGRLRSRPKSPPASAAGSRAAPGAGSKPRGGRGAAEFFWKSTTPDPHRPTGDRRLQDRSFTNAGGSGRRRVRERLAGLGAWGREREGEGEAVLPKKGLGRAR